MPDVLQRLLNLCREVKKMQFCNFMANILQDILAALTLLFRPTYFRFITEVDRLREVLLNANFRVNEGRLRLYWGVKNIYRCKRHLQFVNTIYTRSHLRRA